MLRDSWIPLSYPWIIPFNRLAIGMKKNKCFKRRIGRKTSPCQALMLKIKKLLCTMLL